MHRRVAVCLLLGLLPVAAEPDPADPVYLSALGWTQGAVKQDGDALKRFLSDDLQYAHAGGQLQTKDEYIKSVLTGPPRYESFTFTDVTIRRYGKSAALTAFVDVKMAGRDSFRVRTLQVYVENMVGGKSQWQMAAHQSTRVGR